MCSRSTPNTPKIVRAHDHLGNRLLTQVKDDRQLRRRLELGVADRAEQVRRDEPRPRSLEPTNCGVPTKAWFHSLGKADRPASVRANGLPARPGDWTLRANDQGRLLDFLGFKQNAAALEQWIRAIRRSRTAAATRDTAFADASRIRRTRHRRSPRSFAYNLIPPLAARTSETLAGAPPSISTSSSNCLASIEN